MFNYIINPITSQKISVYSNQGKQLLKQYIQFYKNHGGTNNVNIYDEISLYDLLENENFNNLDEEIKKRIIFDILENRIEIELSFVDDSVDNNDYPYMIIFDKNLYDNVQVSKCSCKNDEQNISHITTVSNFDLDLPNNIQYIYTLLNLIGMNPDIGKYYECFLKNKCIMNNNKCEQIQKLNCDAMKNRAVCNINCGFMGIALAINIIQSVCHLEDILNLQIPNISNFKNFAKSNILSSFMYAEILGYSNIAGYGINNKAHEWFFDKNAPFKQNIIENGVSFCSLMEEPNFNNKISHINHHHFCVVCIEKWCIISDAWCWDPIGNRRNWVRIMATEQLNSLMEEISNLSKFELFEKDENKQKNKQTINNRLNKYFSAPIKKKWEDNNPGNKKVFNPFKFVNRLYFGIINMKDFYFNLNFGSKQRNIEIYKELSKCPLSKNKEQTNKLVKLWIKKNVEQPQIKK